MQIFKEEEMERIYVLRQVKEHKLTQSEAGRQLGLSERQIRRLLGLFLNCKKCTAWVGLVQPPKTGHF